MQEFGANKKEILLHLRMILTTFVAKKLCHMHKNNNRDMVTDYNSVSVTYAGVQSSIVYKNGDYRFTLSNTSKLGTHHYQ